MAFRWISSTFIRVALLIAGTVLLTLGISRGDVWFIVTGAYCVCWQPMCFLRFRISFAKKAISC